MFDLRKIDEVLGLVTDEFGFRKGDFNVVLKKVGHSYDFYVQGDILVVARGELVYMSIDLQKMCLGQLCNMSDDLGLDIFTLPSYDEINRAIRDNVISNYIWLPENKDDTIGRLFFNLPEWGQVCLNINLDYIPLMAKRTGYNVEECKILLEKLFADRTRITLSKEGE